MRRVPIVALLAAAVLAPAAGAATPAQIVAAPLSPGTRYTAAVTVAGGGDSRTTTWSFRTAR